MTGKILKWSKKSLSFILCLTILLTTFCFFDIGSVLSDAMLTVTQKEQMKGALSSQYAYAPEIIYLAPGKSDFKYYSDYNPDTGAAIAENKTSSRLEFDYKGASSIIFAVNNVYAKESGAQVPVKSLVINDTKIAVYAGCSANSTDFVNSATPIATSTNGSVKINLTSGSLAGAVPGTTYIIQWAIKYVVYGASHVTYMYTGVYVPLLDQAGTSSNTWYIKNGSNEEKNGSYTFITGAFKYSGGNRHSMFTGTGSGLRTAPLIAFSGTGQDGTATIPGGSEQVTSPTNFSTSTPYNVLCLDFGREGQRGDSDIHFETSYTSVPKSYAETAAGTVTVKRQTSQCTTGTAYIVVDNSRYTNYNQIPYLSAGFAQFYHSQHGNGNRLVSIASNKYYYYENSQLKQGTTDVSCSVDTSNYKGGENNSIARGLFAFNGAVKTGLITFNFHFKNGYKLGPVTETMHVYHHNALYTQVVNKSSLRTVYNAAAHSHIDQTNYGTAYSNYYTQLKTLAEKLCDPQAYTDLTTSLNVDSIETNLVKNLTVKDDYVYFVAPEAIYLKPSVATSGTYSTQYVLNQTLTLNNSTKTCTETVNQGYDTMSSNGGKVYFYYKNADKVKITYSASGFSGLTASGSATSFGSWIACSPDSITTLTVKNGSSTTYSSQYINWTATYWEDNIEKTVTAKTYIYAPSTSTVVSATNAHSNSTSRHRYAMVSTGIYGIHSVVSNQGATTISVGNRTWSNRKGTDIDCQGSYRYNPIVYHSDYLSNNNFTPSGYPVPYWCVDNDKSGKTQNSPNNSTKTNHPHNIINENVGTGASCWYARDNDYSEKEIVYIGGRGKIIYDSARVKKIGDVPNFGLFTDILGLDSTTHLKDTSTYQAAYFVGNTSTVYSNNSSNGISQVTYASEKVNIHVNNRIRKMPFDNGTNESDFLEKAISGNTTVVSYGMYNVSTYKSGKIGYADAFATCDFEPTDRSGLRSAVEYATNYSYALQEKYFTDTESETEAWMKYTAALENAQNALAKIDGTADYGAFDRDNLSNCGGLAKELKAAVDELIGTSRGVSPRKNTTNTAAQYNVGLMPNGDGTYTIAPIGQADKESTSSIVKSFYAYDRLEYTSESYKGYTYVGYIKDGDSASGGTMTAATYSSIATSTDPLTKSKNTYLLYGNADPVDYSYTFYYLYQPELTFDNAFMFDSILNEGANSSDMIVDYAADSITLKLTGTDACSGTGWYGMKSAKFPVIPGHTYRLYAEVESETVSYTYEDENKNVYGNMNMYIFTYENEELTSTDANNWKSASVNADGIINGTYTIPAGRTYGTIRVGVPTSANSLGSEVTFKNIYIQDITNSDGIADDIKMAEPKSKHLDPGTEVGTLASTDRTGYKFKGWNTKTDGTGETFTEETTMPGKSTRLYSQWEKAQYKTEFNLNYEGSAQTNLFAPYYIGADGKYALRSTVNVTNGTVTYTYNLGEDTYTVNKTGSSTAAIYSEAQENLRLVDTGNGGQYKLKVTKISDGGSDANSSITFQPLKNGQDVGGWTSISATAANGTTVTCPTDSSLNLTDSDYLTLRIYVHGGGSAYKISNLKLKIELTKETTNSGNTPMARYTEYNTQLGALPTPTRTGYTFDGWYLEKEKQKNQVTESTLTPSQDQILYAKWTANKYTITFNGNNGKMGNDTTRTYTATFDSPDYSKVEWLDPQRTGYEFVGWYDAATGGNQVYNSAGTAVNSKYWEVSGDSFKYKWPNNLTVYAHWSKVTFTITYSKGTQSEATLSPADNPVTYSIEDRVTTAGISKTGYTFAGWKVTATSGKWTSWTVGTLYKEKYQLPAGMYGNVTLEAQWIETGTADNKTTEYGTKNFTATITEGIQPNGNPKTKSVTRFTDSDWKNYQAKITAYRNALDTFKNDVTNTANRSALETAIANLKAVTLNEAKVDKSYINSFYVKSDSSNRHNLTQINLNHYISADLDAMKNAFAAATKVGAGEKLFTTTVTNGVSTSVISTAQTTINENVRTMAQKYDERSHITTQASYKVYENASAAMAAKDSSGKNIISGTITAMNYVYTGKGNYTYYCYTNSANPTVLMTVNDTAVSGGRVCYPTKAEKVSATTTGTGKATDPTFSKISVANNTYSTYTGAGIGYGSGAITTADYYKQQTAITLKPTFTQGTNGTAVYTIKAYDDAYTPNYATQSQLTNGNATDNKLRSIPQTAQTAANTITIVIDYHGTTSETGSSNSFCATGAQVDFDKYLNQYHLFRSSGGAQNWELPKIGEAAYTVNDGTYGQTDYGSFTYTFVLGSSDNFANGVLSTKDTAAVAAKIKNNYAAMKSLKLTSAKTGTGSTAGLGYGVWGNNWSYNYYPKTGAYTYVHLVDRWGNVFDKVFFVGPQDYAEIKSQSNGNGYTLIEDGGSGIDTLSLNAAGYEILTDNDSTLENGVYRTTGNTIRIKTGAANTSCSIKMTDKATNSSTAALVSDENGIITLSIEDTAYKSGVYTFMLDGTEINLYDGVETSKYIKEVYSDEAEEGEVARLTVITTGEVSKTRITDADGNTITNNVYTEREDGTREFVFERKLAAGTYSYKIEAKSGKVWYDEGKTGVLTFTEKVLASGVIKAAEYDAATGLCKVTVEGRAGKVQIVSADGSTRTYTRYHKSVTNITSYDANGAEVSDTSRELDSEVWTLNVKLTGTNYTVAGKFEAGWNRTDTATKDLVINK